MTKISSILWGLRKSVIRYFKALIRRKYEREKLYKLDLKMHHF